MTHITDNESFKQSYAKHMQGLTDTKNTASSQLKSVFLYLKSHEPSLCTIEIEYKGSGDSGQVEDISFRDADDKSIEVSLMADPVPPSILEKQVHTWRWDAEAGRSVLSDGHQITVEEALSDLGWDIAYGLHPGFEINEGGYGTVRIGFLDEDSESGTDRNPDDVSLQVSHHEIIETTENYTHYL